MTLPIFIIVVLIFSAIAHEYMHGWMANELGDPTAKNAGRLTLNPIAHLDFWGSVLLPILLYYTTGFIFGYAKPVPINPNYLRHPKYDMIKVALAGPLTNLTLAICFGLVVRFAPMGNQFFGELLSYVVQINLLLFVFNMVPIPPLDGSRVLFPFLPRAIQKFYLSIERFGTYIALLFVLLFFPFIWTIVNFLLKLIIG